MTDELIDKLRLAFSESLERENQVVFILSKTRKLIERESLNNKYLVLKRYTDWAFHTEISGTAPLSPILEKIEQAVLKEENSAIPVFELIEF